MATQIDNLTAATALDGTEGLHVVQGGNSRLATAVNVAGTLVTKGNWTPVISDGTNTDATYAIQSGRYIKVGSLVTIFGNVKISSLGSISGPLIISGLPFTTANIAQLQPSINFGFGGGLNVAAGDVVSGLLAPNSNNITLYLWTDAAGVLQLTSTDLSADGQVLFSGSYEVT